MSSPVNARLFFFTNAGIAIAAPVAASVPVLYNPIGSGVIARVHAVRLGVVSGTVLAGAILYGWAQTTFTGVTAGPSPVNAVLGNDASSTLLWYTAATAAAAPASFGPSGVSSGGALAAGPLYYLEDEPDIIIRPGFAFWPLLANTSLGLSALVALDVYQSVQ
jgi:hypothetical protein